MNTLRLLCAAALVLLTAATVTCAETSSPYERWKNGPSTRADYFPIGVWLQDPAHAERYKQIGINLYVGLWQGPTQAQLQALRDAEMPVIAAQNAYARQLLAEGNGLLAIVVGWAQPDEPDNAQPRAGGGWGPPEEPAAVIERYGQINEIDPTRPVYLNLGQGVAWDGWIGRGVRTGQPQDYTQYVKGADILSFDVYPAASDREIAGELWRVGHGTARLRKWAAPEQPVWAFIECTRVSGRGKATPHEVRAMVWMALVNGAMGIEYFVHEWDADGKFISDHALLNDAEMSAAVAAINAQIHELAPVLNTPSLPEGMTVASDNADIPIDWILKQHNGQLYLFAVATRDGETTATFDLAGIKNLDPTWTVRVIGGDRQIELRDGRFQDTFGPWDVRLYHLTP